MARDRGLVRHAGGILVAEKLHVAAERNGGDLPAGAVAIGEAEQLRAETDGKDQHPHAAPARDQEMAELVEEHDDAQDEQKRNDPAGQPAPQSPKLLKMSIPDLVPAPLRSAPANLLG